MRAVLIAWSNRPAAAYDAAQTRAADEIVEWVAEHATTRVGPRGRQVQVPVEKIEAKEYKPSRQAPEAPAKMNAMRDLANETRRTAIASHAKRNWSSVMKLKVLVSIFAACAVLASVVFF